MKGENASSGQVECACWSRSLAWDFVLPFGIVVIATMFMALGDRELVWHKTLYDFDNHDWSLGKAAFWKFLYRAAAVPALITVVGAAVVYVAGFRVRKLGPYRRVALYMILLVVLAPGVIANLVLKEHWGRPRPRDISEFGGRYAYESVLAPDPESTGRSFVCGHATMAFYFMGGWFLFRNRRRAWGYVFLIGGLGYGALVGYMRMLQGGHFASDVLWAGAVTYFTAAALFYLLGLNRNLLPDPFTDGVGKRHTPLWVKLAGLVVAAGMVASVLLATPYKAERDYVSAYDPSGEKALKVRFSTLLGNVNFVSGDIFSIRGRAFGHGVPTSGILDRWKEEQDDEGGTVLRYWQRLSGWFSEVEQNLQVSVPWRRVSSFQLIAGPGKITMAIPRPDQAMTIRLVADEFTEFEIQLLDEAVIWVPDLKQFEISNEVRDKGIVVLGSERPRANHLITLRRLEKKGGDGKLQIKFVTEGE